MVEDTQPFKTWFDSPAGRQVLAAETALLEAVYTTLFGYWIVQVGAWGRNAELLGTSKIRGQALITEAPSAANGFASEPHALAIASDSVDVVLLPHRLERAAEPHVVLREAERILVGEGHVLIFGFNPWSPWGLRRRLARSASSPWAGRYISEHRLKDWLSLLGFEVVRTERYLHGLPSEHPALLRRLDLTRTPARFLAPGLAGGYFIVARKRVVALTPFRPMRLRRRHGLVGGLKPTTRCHG